MNSFVKWMKITSRCVPDRNEKLSCFFLFLQRIQDFLNFSKFCPQDDFNLTGLNTLVPYYDYALDMVLDVEMPMEDSLTEEQQEIVESAAEMLYGLIHARYVNSCCKNRVSFVKKGILTMLVTFSFCSYILTNRGMHAMYEKYRTAAFGRCPRVFCQGQPVLPVGLSDLPRNYTVNVFCPRCHGLFFPKSTRQANIDGAYFGTTFPHLYLLSHSVRLSSFARGLSSNHVWYTTHTDFVMTTGFNTNQTSPGLCAPYLWIPCQ